jgi:ribosome-interacting GTPase 1
VRAYSSDLRDSLPQITVDELIDVLIGTRKYVPCLYVFNKIDAISLEQMDKYARQDHSMVISCEMDLKYVHP